MNDPDLILPWFTSHSRLLVVFFTSLVAFHLLFLRFFPLSLAQWKRVDYIWLTMALVGILGSVSENRASVVGNLHKRVHISLKGSFDLVVRAVEFGSSPTICRVFVPSVVSPPPEIMAKAQHEFDEQCAWFNKLLKALKAREINSSKSIDVVELAGAQPAGGLDWAYQSLSDSVDHYNNSLEDLLKLEAEKAANVFEMILQFLGPVLILLALSLRITKVSGEIFGDHQYPAKL